MVTGVLSNLRVGAIAYPFGSSVTTICPLQPLATLVLTDEALAESAKINELVTDSSSHLASEIAGLAVLADSTSLNVSLVKARGKAATAPLTDAVAWAHQNLFGCGDDASTERIDLSHFVPIELP